MARLLISAIRLAVDHDDSIRVAAFQRVRRTVRILLLSLTAVTAGCAHANHHTAYRLGPSLCQEGPPTWSASDGRQIMYRTWGPPDEALKLGERARIAAPRLKVPVLMLTGDKDPIGTAGVGQRAFSALMKRFPSSAKERDRFPDGYHDLIHDKNKEQAMECIGAWIEREL